MPRLEFALSRKVCALHSQFLSHSVAIQKVTEYKEQAHESHDGEAHESTESHEEGH